MKIAVFDVETTDLIKNSPSFHDTEKWPYIVQISLILYNDENNSIEKINHIIKIPNHVEISDKSQQLHGCSKEICNKEGVVLSNVLPSINDKFKQADVIVCHNVSFDKRMYIVECIRNNIESCFNKKEYCTMKNTVNICAIKTPCKNNPNNYYNKYPKLIELYKHLFDEDAINLHNALTDVIVCLRCYYKINYNKDLYEQCNEYKDLFNINQLRTTH